MDGATEDETPYFIERLEGRLTDLSKREQVRALHGACYPGEQNPDDSLDEIFQQITFLHEEEDCTWLLLWLPTTSGHYSPNRLVAMLVSVDYHDSTYAFGYGVLPSFRKMGLGKRLMYELEKRTIGRGRPGRISSTVDSRQPRLLEYYRRQGGTIKSNGITSSDAQLPPSVRVVKEFDEDEAQAGIDSAHAAILLGLSVRKRRQELLSWVAIAAPIAAAVAVLWLLSSRKRPTQHAMYYGASDVSGTPSAAACKDAPSTLLHTSDTLLHCLPSVDA